MQTPAEELTPRMTKVCPAIGCKSVSICVHLWLNCSSEVYSLAPSLAAILDPA